MGDELIREGWRPIESKTRVLYVHPQWQGSYISIPEDGGAIIVGYGKCMSFASTISGALGIIHSQNNSEKIMEALLQNVSDSLRIHNNID